MHPQTVDQAMSLLSLVQQPAFCIRQNGTMICNKQAQYLSPSCSAELSDWLGDTKPAYDLWDHTGNLQLIVSVQNLQYSVILQPLQDGTLFLMNPCADITPSENVLAVTSQVLRTPLSELSALLNQVQRGKAFNSAAFYQQLLRMTRIVHNLNQTCTIRGEDFRMHISRLDTDMYLAPLMDEVKQLVCADGRAFSYELPKKPLSFYADSAFLSCAILNLISNALKFSPSGSAVCVRVEAIGTHMVIQVENACSESSSEVLRSAFSRLTHRGMLPDPKWGLGLGLPLVNSIARLHGGMIALETVDDRAIVSLSISLRNREDEVLASSMTIDYTGGMRQSLLELSDALHSSAFE